MALIALAALQAVPRDITAASIVDGAGVWTRFRFVILPYLAGPLIVALVLRTIEAFKVFDIIWVMTRGGPANSTERCRILVYQEAFSFQRAGSGASLALIVTLVSAVLAAAYAALMRRQAEVPLMSRRGRASPFAVFIHAAALLLAVRDPGAGRLAVGHERQRHHDLTAKPLHWWPAECDFSRYVKLLTIAENSAGAAFIASLRNSMKWPAWRRSLRAGRRHPGGLGRLAHAVGLGWSLYGSVAT